VRNDCLGCRRFPTCLDPNKSAGHICDQYASQKVKEALNGTRKETSLIVPTSISNDYEKQELGLVEMLDSVMDPDALVPFDLKIDDRDLPEFANFYDFCFSKQGANQAPFARQLALAIHLFAEWCPSCSDSRFANIYTVPLRAPAVDFPEHVTFLEHGVCPKCKATRSDLIKKGDLSFYQELAAAVGQRGGKSAISALMAAYVLHKYLKLQKPTEVFGLMRNSLLVGTVAALTYGKAVELLWMPILNVINNCEWFLEYHKLMDFYAEKYNDEDLYKLKDSFIHYKHRSIFFHPSGPSKRTMRGACLIGSTLVNTNYGLVHMDEFIDTPGFKEVRGLKIANHKGHAKVSHTYLTHRPTIKIQTLNGYSLTGSPEHPVLVLTPDLQYKWRRLDALSIGDYIVSHIPNVAPMFGGNKSVSKNMATLLGYMTANGYRNEISSSDTKVIRRLRRAAKQVTGYYPTSSTGDDVRAANHYIRVGEKGENCGTFQTRYLNPLGYRATNSYDKEIPLSVRTSPKRILHEYLEAYFECDCGIDTYWNDGNTRNPTIAVSSASKKLIKQLHFILLHVYGIVGRYTHFDYVSVSGSKSHLHHISISGYDTWLFLHTFRRAKPHRYADRFHYTPPGFNSDRRQVPWVKRFLFNLIESCRAESTGKYRSKLLVTASGKKIINNVRPLCFGRVSNYPMQKDDPYASCPESLIYEDDWDSIIPFIEQLSQSKAGKIRNVVDKRCHYEKVVAVLEGDSESVYDVTVPGSHAFMSNGLVSHNTRFLSIIDEIGWMDNSEEGSRKERASASEVYIALDRSLKTVRSKAARLVRGGFDNIPNAYAINISSPSSQTDKIMSLVRTHAGSTEVLTVHLPTWKFNPEYKKSDFKKEYRDNPVNAERDFGANPPMSDNPFIPNIEKLYNKLRNPSNRVSYKYVVKKNLGRAKANKHAKIVSVKGGSIEERSIMAIDAGATNNSFALCVAHVKETEGLRYYVIDTLVEVAPQRNHDEVNFTAVADELLYPLIEQMNVGWVVADRWNSKKMLDDIRDKYGIETDTYSLRYDDLLFARDYLVDEEAQVLLPKTEMPFNEIMSIDLETYPHCFKYMPCAHLIFQCGTVVDYGNTVEKAARLTDDLFRSVVLALTYMLDDEFAKEYLINKQKTSGKRVLGAIGGRSTGIGGGFSGSSKSKIGAVMSRGR